MKIDISKWHLMLQSCTVCVQFVYSFVTVIEGEIYYTKHDFGAAYLERTEYTRMIRRSLVRRVNTINWQNIGIPFRILTRAKLISPAGKVF